VGHFTIAIGFTVVIGWVVSLERFWNSSIVIEKCN